MMSNTRTETDSLGPIEVPASALYGAQTTRARANFPICGLRASPFLIRALAMVKQAAAEANQDLGLITKIRAAPSIRPPRKSSTASTTTTSSSTSSRPAPASACT